MDRPLLDSVVIIQLYSFFDYLSINIDRIIIEII